MPQGMILDYIKFAYVVVCFFIALCSFWVRHSTKDWCFLAIGMGTTVVADYFLLVTHNYPVGVLVFCFVHVFYMLRMSDNYKKSLKQMAVVASCACLFF